MNRLPARVAWRRQNAHALPPPSPFNACYADYDKGEKNSTEETSWWCISLHRWRPLLSASSARQFFVKLWISTLLVWTIFRRGDLVKMWISFNLFMHYDFFGKCVHLICFLRVTLCMNFFGTSMLTGYIFFEITDPPSSIKWPTRKKHIGHSELHRKQGRISIFNQSINGHHHMKDHVESSHLTKCDAFGANRDQVIDHVTWFKIHTNASNFWDNVPQNLLLYRPFL